MGEIRRGMLQGVDCSWEAMQKALGRVQPHRLEEAGVVEAWSVKDLMGHVTAWERQAMSTILAFQESGDADALKWADIDGFNALTAKSNSSRPLEELRSDMETVNDELLAFIDGLPEEIAEDDGVRRRVGVEGSLAIDTSPLTGLRCTLQIRVQPVRRTVPNERASLAVRPSVFPCAAREITERRRQVCRHVRLAVPVNAVT